MESKITLRKRTPKKYSFEEEDEEYGDEGNEESLSDKSKDKEHGEPNSLRKVSIETYDTDNDSPGKKDFKEASKPDLVIPFPVVETASPCLKLRLGLLKQAASNPDKTL